MRKPPLLPTTGAQVTLAPPRIGSHQIAARLNGHTPRKFPTLRGNLSLQRISSLIIIHKILKNFKGFPPFSSTLNVELFPVFYHIYGYFAQKQAISGEKAAFPTCATAPPRNFFRIFGCIFHFFNAMRRLFTQCSYKSGII